MFPQIKYRWFPFLAVVVVIALSAVSFIYAWTEPLLSPPDGNVAAPVNVSNNSQTFVDTKTLRVKTDGTGVLVIEGGLRSDTFRTLYQSTLATTSGNVGIGTTTPDATLHLDSRDTGSNLQIRMENWASGDTSGQYSTITSSRLSNGNSSLMFGTTLNGINNTRFTINNSGVLTFSPINFNELTGSSGSIYYNSITNRFRCYQGGVWTDCVGGAGGGGLPLGTINQTLRHDGTNWLASGLLLNDSSRIGIGGMIVNTKLAVVGSGLDNGLYIKVDYDLFEGSEKFVFNVSSGNNSKFFVSRSGRVGIGTSTLHQNLNMKLDVAESALIRENFYVHSPSFSGDVVVGIGELGRAIADWEFQNPQPALFGIGWSNDDPDTPTINEFAIGTRIPSGETFGFYGDPSNVYISGNLGVGTRYCPGGSCQRKVNDFSKLTVHGNDGFAKDDGIALRNGSSNVWTVIYNDSVNSAAIDVTSGGGGISDLGPVLAPGTTPQTLKLNPSGGYVQFPTRTVNPVATDCDDDSEAGRVYVQIGSTDTIHICKGSSGWLNI